MLAWPASAPWAQDLQRGRELYESKCGACHERTVHWRASRIAIDFPTLRAEVSRWSTTAGTDWRAEEIDLVTHFLNDRHYQFPCPTTVCRAPARAQAQALTPRP